MAEVIKYNSLSSGEVLPFTAAKDGIFINTDIDIQEIVDIINSPTIASRYRIYVLYPDETINYEIPNEDIQLGGSYSENYQNGSRRSLSFSLFNEDGKYTPNINTFWAGLRLRLDLGLEMPDGTIIWFIKGIFIINSAQPSISQSAKTVNINATDKFSLFEGKTGTFETTYEIPVGQDIQEVISSILLMFNGNGEVYDPQPIIYHSAFKGKQTQATISKSAGETYGSVLLELATQLSAEMFYNSMGQLTVVPINETTIDVDKPLIYEFETINGDINSLSFDFNMTEMVNRIVVIGTSSTGGVCRAVAVNDNPSSPLCYTRIGYRTGNIINDSNITTDLLAQERADYELRAQSILKSSSSINVVYNPLLAVNNLVAISDEFFSLTHEKFLIQNISCNLDYSGTMNITISNTQNLPFLV